MNGVAIPLQEAVNIFYARQFAYDILRRFFIEEPNVDYLKPFVHKNMINLFPFKEESEGIQEGISDIKAYLSAHDVVNIDRDFQELHWDFTRLFVGPFELPTPPWESSYVRKDGLLFQETTMKIRQLYEKYGMEVTDFNIEADDHIGLELDFIYHLNELCIQLAESSDGLALDRINLLLREQHRFINDHLLKFVPELSQSIKNEANTQFFVGLAKILNHYTQMDSEVLQELMNIEII